MGPRRDDYRSMAAEARSLQEAGKSQDEILLACYGVPFPEETFAMAELLAEKREPDGLYTNLPWNLLVTLDRGGPPVEPDVMDEDERRVFALDPRLVPLMILRGDFYEYAGTMLCYRLDELAAGRATIWGFQSDLTDDDAVARQYGDSLATVIHACCVDTLRRAEKEYARPYNQGAGAIDKYEVDAAREDLARADELIRRVAERRRPKLVP